MTDLYRARATLTVSGVPCLITTYWQKDVAVTPDQAATEALARVRAMFASAASTILAGSSLTFDTSVQVITDSSGTLTGVGTGSSPAAVTFTGSGEPLPLQTQALARFGTAAYVRGRNLRGRMFIPGIVEAGSSSGIGPTAAYITSWNTALGLLGTTVVSNISQVVWSRPTAPGATDGQFGNVTSRSLSPNWAVQKGRRP